jgi:uncharacterized protein (DUF924 family)
MSATRYEEDQDTIVVDVYDEKDMKCEDRRIQEKLEEINRKVQDTGKQLTSKGRTLARRNMLSGVRGIMKRQSSKFYESDIRAMRDTFELMTRHLVHFQNQDPSIPDVIVVDVYDESDMKHEDREIQEKLEEINSEVRDMSECLTSEERTLARRNMLSGIRKIMKRESSKFYESDIRAMRDAFELMNKHLVRFEE